MRKENYPSNLVIKLRLNAVGVPCDIRRIANDNGDNVLNEFSSEERAALASGADEVLLNKGVRYERSKPSTGFGIGPDLVIKYRRRS